MLLPSPLAMSGQEQQAFGPNGRGLSTVHGSPNLLAPRLTCALPLAERWDSLSEAAGCQERRSPRRSWVKCMWVTASQKEAFHSPLPSFTPPSRLPFCPFVPSRSFGFPPSLLTSRKLTLISVCPVFWALDEPKAEIKLQPVDLLAPTHLQHVFVPF